ncbi:phosphatidate cytidylyltransferase [Ornithinimicrobium sediminis]|uniref:phosphatidate cytidylyltransferase n=1 Tax=Ornithinimicrobium sediminis TaxID=2904603 RepID=UPI001E3D947E|nr:phosphatidate cytidylyltransferase [Ornithinimicrobium sediminis]MCE0486649.1 phosphatidate cytidylyltransferase [Ornithinimicrobium sediminis]
MPETVTSRRSYKARLRAGAGQDTTPVPSKAGRNLPAAVAVGVVLVALIMASLYFWKPAFAIVVTLAVGVAMWELVEALRSGHIEVPLVPTVVAGLLLVPAAYLGGAEGLATGFALGCLGVLLWRAVEGSHGALRDIAGGVFVLAYVPLLAGLSALMLAEDDGPQRILVFVLVTISSDIGGYAVGVLFGRHAMAPSLSPKKSWEGFAGSVLSCVLVGVVSIVVLLDGPWWAGVVLGVAVACFATVGDLAESTLKRDVGIKDMSSILPGHGGVMDRLDSLLMTVPVSWALLTLFVPA